MCSGLGREGRTIYHSRLFSLGLNLWVQLTVTVRANTHACFAAGVQGWDLKLQCWEKCRVPWAVHCWPHCCSSSSSPSCCCLTATGGSQSTGHLTARDCALCSPLAGCSLSVLSPFHTARLERGEWILVLPTFSSCAHWGWKQRTNSGNESNDGAVRREVGLVLHELGHHHIRRFPGPDVSAPKTDRGPDSCAWALEQTGTMLSAYTGINLFL